MAVGFVLIKTEPGRERAVYEGLLRVGGIQELFPLFGEYDFVARMEAPDFDALGQIIIARVRTLPGVTSTHTLTVAKH